MSVINIHEIKAHLSAYIERVEQGETLVICRRNQPVAELRPVRAMRRVRSVAPAATLEIPVEFDAPLPASIVAAFGGHGGSASTGPDAPASAWRVADAPPREVAPGDPARYDKPPARRGRRARR